MLGVIACASVESVDETANELCGDEPMPLVAGVRNVLLLGDSISEPTPPGAGGYGAFVREMLVTKGINVWHNGGWDLGGQASNTVKGLLCTNASTPGEWLNFTGKYDVIHYNFGLHDLVTGVQPSQHVDLGPYGANLQAIHRRLAPRASKGVVWASTTPCPNVTTSYGRTDAKVRAYNKRALEALGEVAGADLHVNDLYAAIIGYCGLDYKSCDLQLPTNVHFTTKGQQFMAERVVDSVLKLLQA